MKRVTNFAMVDYIVPDSLVLPDEIRDELRLYEGVHVTNIKTGEGGTRYRIPDYLREQWLDAYANDPQSLLDDLGAGIGESDGLGP